MPEKTKPDGEIKRLEMEEDDDDRKAGRPEDRPGKSDSTWARDQRERGYYYDDSHGYEIYDPGEDEEEDEEA